MRFALFSDILTASPVNTQDGNRKQWLAIDRPAALPSA